MNSRATCILLLASVFAAGFTAEGVWAAQPCATHLRFVHGHATEDKAVNVILNDVVAAQGLEFRGATRYTARPHGSYKIRFEDAASGKVLGEKSFVAGSGQAYTIVLAGPSEGPPSSLYGNKSPFIFLDEITPPNPGRWKGHWYRMSETNVVIDFRISRGDDPTKEVYRLVDKPNRASYSLADAPAGLYQFNPVLPGSSAPFFNEALDPPAYVQLTGVQLQGGEVMDVFALGNALGEKLPNSLQLSYQKFVPVVDESTGCIEVKY